MIKKEKRLANEKGDIVLEGWIPVEYLEIGFPIIQKSKIKSHTAILLREKPAWLQTSKPVFVRITLTPREKKP